MKVFARFELSRGRLHPGERALLLEGQWPRDPLPGSQPTSNRGSLDREIDSRFGWIDQRAAELAEHFAAAEQHNGARPGLAWLNVVKLRYLLVKLLRVVAFFDTHDRASSPESCDLFFEPGRDACYLHLMRALGRQIGLEVVAHDAVASDMGANTDRPIAHGWAWRRAAESWARHFQPAVAYGKPRVVLCGNPRLLAPVCRELVRRGMQPWWLVERFAPRSWLRWRRFGGGMLTCDGAQGSEDSEGWPEAAPHATEARWPVETHWPVAELVAPAVNAWLHELHGQLGPVQARQSAQIGRHLDSIQPLHVVLDQDGSPFNRAVVARARARGVQTAIVQHGAPFIRFGFAPLTADRFCAWGETSCDQLVRWGVPRERICVTGTAMTLPAKHVGRRLRSARGPQLVLLATLAPADGRPDAVTYHLTSSTFAAMIRSALAAVSNWPGARLLIKLHPRDPRSPEIRSIAAKFDHIPVKIVFGRSLSSALRGADCVLSCASSAGIEAAARGWPVIQLMPEGSGELLEATAWGLVGTARNQSELECLIGTVLAGRGQLPDAKATSTIAATGRAAASHTVDALLAPAAAHPPHNIPAETVCV